MAKGCDPFIGRKLHKYLSEAGFEILTNQVKLSTYDSKCPAEYLTAIGNLSQIFLSNGPTFFGLENESPVWQAIQLEINSFSQGTVLTEGYFISIGKKMELQFEKAFLNSFCYLATIAGDIPFTKTPIELV